MKNQERDRTLLIDGIAFFRFGLNESSSSHLFGLGVALQFLGQ